MLAAGNGKPEQCVFNLMSIIKGEAPFERCKGISAEVSDKPLTASFGEVVTETSWNIMYYEPRAKDQNISMVVEDAIRGRYRAAAAIETNGG